MSHEVLAILITAIVLAIDLFTDYRLRLKYRDIVKPDGSVNHVRGFWLRALGLAPAIWLSWYDLTFLLLFVYWHVYDGLSNVLWNNNWFRVGTTSSIDKFEEEYPIVVWIKYAGLFVSALFYLFYKLHNQITL